MPRDLPSGPCGVPEDLDVLLPSQRARCSPESPEHALALAVLARAVADVQGRSPTAPRQVDGQWFARTVASAAAWIDADDGAWPFSFVSICDLLGLDPAGVRRALAGRRAA